MAVGVSIADALKTLRGTEYVVQQSWYLCKYSYSRIYILVNTYNRGNFSNETQIRLSAFQHESG